MQHNIQPNHYQPSPADLVTDLERISRFFLNEAAVKKQLAKLEQALEVEAGERIGANKLFKDYVPNQPYKHQKLLSAFFKSWGSANGFNGWKALDGHQTNQSFYQTLFDGLLFKDSHFRSPIKSKHGEYSHLLQWYCLVEQNNDEKFLTHLPANIYRDMITINANLWFRHFEAGDAVLHDSDFNIGNALEFNRVLHRYFDEGEYPVLRQLIIGRELKPIKDLSPPI